MMSFKGAIFSSGRPLHPVVFYDIDIYVWYGAMFVSNQDLNDPLT
jgi:hypothetical protein